VNNMFMYSGEMLNHTSNWYGADDETNFKNIIKKYPNTRWKNELFEYSFNEHGYRTKPISKISWDNYFIALGCSCTMGMGLPVDLAWPGLISSSLNLDVVNLGKAGSSTDFVHTNFIHSIDKVPQLPKLVMISWPPIFRFLWFKYSTQPRMSIYHYYVKPENHEISELCIPEDSMSKDLALIPEIDHHLLSKWYYTRKSIKLLCNSMGIKYLDFSFFEDYKNEVFQAASEFSDDDNFMHNEYWARDSSHLGTAHHRIARDYLLSCIK